MPLLSSIPPHSAVVHITLHAAGREWNVAQMGSDFIILREAANEFIPPGPARITLTVDGAREEIPVRLLLGISAGSRRAAIAEGTATLAGAVER